MFKKIFLILILAGFSGTFFASGWPVKKGSGYFQLSTQYMGSDKYYNADGDKIDSPEFSDLTFSIFGSYGVTDKISLYGSFPVIRSLSVENPMTFEEFTKTGSSDFTIGMKYYLGKIEKMHFSAKVSVGIPVGDNEDENLLYTGDGEWNQFFAIAVGRSLGNGFYFGADAGYSNRNEGYSDDILYNAELGYKLMKNLLVMIKINGKQPLENGSDDYLGGVAGLAANNQKYLAFGPELLYSINDHVGVNVALQTGINTSNVISAIVFKGGVYYKL